MGKAAIILQNNVFQLRIKELTDIFWFLKSEGMVREYYAVNTDPCGTPV
jgi:hypothetical protein